LLRLYFKNFNIYQLNFGLKINECEYIYRKYKITISSTKTKAMAMWGNHIQRVKIVINDNIIEQV